MPDQPWNNVQCKDHPSNMYTHGCLEENCKQKYCLFCSECLMNELTSHTTAHKDYIKPIDQFFETLIKDTENYKLQLEQKEFKDIKQNQSQIREDQLKKVVIPEQKKQIINVFKFFKEKVCLEIDKIQTQMVKDLELCEDSLKKENIKYEQILKQYEEMIQLKSNQVRADVAKNKNTLHDYSLFMKKRLTTIKNENYGPEFLEKTQEIKKVIDNYGQTRVFDKFEYNAKINEALNKFNSAISEECIQYIKNIKSDKPPKEIVQEKKDPNQDLAKKQENVPTQIIATKQSLLENQQFLMNQNPIVQTIGFTDFLDPSPILNNKIHLGSQNAFIQLNQYLNNNDGLLSFNLKFDSYANDLKMQGFFAQLSLDNDQIVIGGQDGKLKIYRIYHSADESLLNEFITELVPPQDLCLPVSSMINVKSDKDDSMIAVGNSYGQIVLWTINKDIRLSSIKVVLKNPKVVINKITAMVDLDNDKNIVSGDKNGTLFLWNHNTRQIDAKFNMHSDQINSILTFLLDNKKMIAVAASDGIITIWNVLDQNNETKIECIRLVTNHQPVLCLIQMDPYTMVLSDSLSRIKILDLIKLSIESVQFSGQQDTPFIDLLCVEFSTDQTSYQLILGFTKFSITIINGLTLEPIDTFKSQDFQKFKISFDFSKVFFIKGKHQKKQIFLSKDAYLNIIALDANQHNKSVFQAFALEF